MNVEMRTMARPGDRRVAGLLLLLLFALLTLGASRLAPTADETAHMAGGYGLATRGTEALPLLAQRGYPPMMPAMQGALIALAHPRISVTALTGWPDSFDIFAESFAAALTNFGAALFASRMPAIWLTVLMATIVYRWATLAFGRLAGLAALGLCLVDPTLLAHGRLATTDAGVTCFGLAALYTAWRWTRVGGWRWSLACGALLGATMLTKISGPLWLVAVGLILLSGAVWRRPLGRGAVALHLATTVGLGFAILWAAYGFQIGPLGDTGLLVPAPSHWESTFYLSRYHSLFFALGERQRESWWWYFPVAFLIKNPVPLLIFWLTGVVALILYRRFFSSLSEPHGPSGADTAPAVGAVSRLALATVLIFPLIYALVAPVEGMNIGYRHMLPIHPLLHIAAGLGLATIWQRHRWLYRALIAVTGLVAAVGTWRLFPDELAFFSAIVGGPEGGYRYLTDSNLDWGQHIGALEAYLTDHPDTSPDPPERPFRPAAGRYIVGASELQGVGVADPYAYEWFRHQDPAEQPVPGLLVYDVAPFPTAWVAQCGAPEVPLTAEQMALGFGGSLRTVGFSCSEAWLLPDGGTTPGIYVLPAKLLAPRVRRFPSGLLQPPGIARSELQRWLAPTRLSFYNQQVSRGFALYEFTPLSETTTMGPAGSLGEVGPAKRSAIYRAPADTVPSALGNIAQIATCVDLNPAGTAYPCPMTGPLSFLGISVTRGERAIDIETWWRVDEGPIARNFSLMGHLIGPDGAVFGTDDGAGVMPTTLLAGDVFAQLHRFTAPDTATDLWFRTGAYWLDSKARWSVGDGGADAFLVAVR